MSEVVWETLQYFQKFAKPAYVLDFQCYMGQSAFQTSSEDSFPSPRRFSVSLSFFKIVLLFYIPHGLLKFQVLDCGLPFVMMVI